MVVGGMPHPVRAGGRVAEVCGLLHNGVKYRTAQAGGSLGGRIATMSTTSHTVGRRRLPTLAGALLLALAMTACSSTASSPAESTAQSAAESVDGGGGGGNVVGMAGSSFSPESITISAGDSVEFTNDDGTSHRIVEGEDGAEVDDPAFEALALSAGDSASVTFDEPGEYQVTCTIHPSMQMTVIVE
jgi:plastocyanin